MSGCSPPLPRVHLVLLAVRNSDGRCWGWAPGSSVKSGQGKGQKGQAPRGCPSSRIAGALLSLLSLALFPFPFPLLQLAEVFNCTGEDAVCSHQRAGPNSPPRRASVSPTGCSLQGIQTGRPSPRTPGCRRGLADGGVLTDRHRSPSAARAGTSWAGALEAAEQRASSIWEL